MYAWNKGGIYVHLFFLLLFSDGRWNLKYLCSTVLHYRTLINKIRSTLETFLCLLISVTNMLLDDWVQETVIGWPITLIIHARLRLEKLRLERLVSHLWQFTGKNWFQRQPALRCNKLVVWCLSFQFIQAGCACCIAVLESFWMCETVWKARLWEKHVRLACILSFYSNDVRPVSCLTDVRFDVCTCPVERKVRISLLPWCCAQQRLD